LSHYRNYDRPAQLPKNPRAVHVKVSLSRQMVYVMEGDRPLLITPATVGAAKTATPQGEFRVATKEKHKRANSHGWAYKGNAARRVSSDRIPAGWNFIGTPMPYWVEFRNHYGFHMGWVKPYAASHGCIRLHENIAPKFFQLVSLGTPISIQQKLPEDETWGKDIQPAPDATPLPDYAPSMYIGDGYFRQHAPVVMNPAH
jgi:lipoprotein-anchoring transpeptidase ErfK/SrfK